MAWTYLDPDYIENQTDYIRDENWGSRKQSPTLATRVAEVDVPIGNLTVVTLIGARTEVRNG